MSEVILQYGLAGAVILGLAGYILKIESRHRKDREEMIKKEEKNFDRLADINDETNKVLRENTNILAGLKTLLENKK